MFAIINTSRDHSRFSLFTAGLACLVPFASAYTKPVGEPNVSSQSISIRATKRSSS